ncbi:MAG: hypothetical protein ACKVQJ_13060 [Pyrinomonadaceae bacterium]
MQRLIFIAVIGLSSAIFGNGQMPSPSPNPPRVLDPSVSIKRWIEIGALSVATRYRYIKNENGVVAANQNQYQVTARFKFKFDSKGRYAVAAGILTGNNFSFGWNNSGWGSGPPRKNFGLRQLYFDAKPGNGFEFQIGSLSFNNGEGTEATSYDNDGYIVGERLQIRRPKQLYFDEISATSGYVGDLLQPNVFRRLRRLSKSNYHQFLIRKQVNKAVGFSSDYTFESGVDTFRQAVKFTIPKSRVFDFVLFENYQRIDPNPGYGFNIYGQKKLNTAFTLGTGFIRIDRTMLNADRFPRGNRIYLNGIVNLSKEFTITTSFTEGVGPIVPTLARRRLDIVLNYNILETLHRLKVY